MYHVSYIAMLTHLNPIALRIAEILQSFGRSEYYRVKGTPHINDLISHFSFLQLYLTIYSLPDGSNYTCVFPELNETSPAQVWSYGVHCRAPDIYRTGYQVKGKLSGLSC